MRPQNKTSRPPEDAKGHWVCAFGAISSRVVGEVCCWTVGARSMLCCLRTHGWHRKKTSCPVSQRYTGPPRTATARWYTSSWRSPEREALTSTSTASPHGGYTPLHVAAMHGHTQLMVLLVQRYGASVHERDNAGKKAFTYLGEDVSAEVRALLGGLQPAKNSERTEEDDYREQPKGLNSISKLFQPHIGRKHKTTAKFAHDWWQRHGSHPSVRWTISRLKTDNTTSMCTLCKYKTT